MTRTVLLGDLVNIKSGKSRPKQVGEFPVYGGNGIFDSAPNANMNEPAVIVGRVGAYCGSVYIEKDPFWLSDNALGVTAKSAINLDFTYYLLRSMDLNRKSVGGAQPLLTQGILNGISVTVPDLGTQKKIADVLKTIDEKIELNRKMNETLEHMGQALFRHYFITNPEAEKWEEKSLDEIANFLNGIAMQRYPKIDGKPTLPVIKIREMTSGITANTDVASANIPEQYIVEKGDLLFSWSGTLLVKFWSEGRGALNQHLFKVTSENYPEWMYFYWTKHHLDDFIRTAKSKATTMGHIQRKHLNQAKVLVPDGPSIDEIGEKLQPIIDQIKSNGIQARNLTELRDTLLPRLISGKVNI